MKASTRTALSQAWFAFVEAGVSGGLQILGADPFTSELSGKGIRGAAEVDSLGGALDFLGIHARRRRTDQVVNDSAARFDSEEDFVTAAISDPARLELTMRVLEAAARTPFPDKLHGLAAVLANGLQDDTIDEALLLVNVISDLEAPHVHLLQAMTDTQGAVAATFAGIDIATGSRTGVPDWIIGWSMSDVADYLGPKSGALARPLIATLARHGLVLEAVPGSNPDLAGRWFVHHTFATTLLSLLGGEVFGAAMTKNLLMLPGYIASAGGGPDAVNKIQRSVNRALETRDYRDSTYAFRQTYLSLRILSTRAGED